MDESRNVVYTENNGNDIFFQNKAGGKWQWGKIGVQSGTEGQLLAFEDFEVL